jgi:hypothetical protein
MKQNQRFLDQADSSKLKTRHLMRHHLSFQNSQSGPIPRQNFQSLLY